MIFAKAFRICIAGWVMEDTLRPHSLHLLRTSYLTNFLAYDTRFVYGAWLNSALLLSLDVLSLRWFGLPGSFLADD